MSLVEEDVSEHTERDKQVAFWRNQVELGEKALECDKLGWWKWTCENILDRLEERAVNKLENAKSDADRMAAQQMLLAARDPKMMFSEIINQARGAAAQLSLLSTQEE